MRLYARLRLPACSACLIGAAALLLGFALISPAPAPASRTRARHAPAHSSTRERCAARMRSGRPARGSRGHGARCVRRRTTTRVASRAGYRGLGSLEATSLYGTGAAPPASSAQAAAALPSSQPSGSTTGPTALPGETGQVVTNPIDPRFLTSVPFGATSFWVQPWRAYQDTWPSSRLLGSVGINFNVGVPIADATAQLLADSGFKLARIPINWSALSYEDPTRFLPEHLTNIDARLTALHNHGLRPLIVLDAYAGAPAPERRVNLESVAPAPAGALTVTLTAASAAQVVPGKTGFNYLSFGGTPDILITSVTTAGVATLSRPLLSALAQGPHGGTTLRFGPFSAPTLANGAPNPAFQETLAGWLSYVAAVSKEAARVVGPEGFDLEIWNELSFGSQFLDAEHYYSSSTPTPALSQASPRSGVVAAAAANPVAVAGAGLEPDANPEEATEPSEGAESANDSESESGAEVEEGSEDAGGETPQAVGEARISPAMSASTASNVKTVTKEVIKALLRATVGYVRDPANGISPGVGITNGFASQTPFPSGAAAPLGLNALSKHPYHSVTSFPTDYRGGHSIPVDALGLRDTIKGSFTPLFVPTYQSLMPEYMLTGVSTFHLIRDIAPITTNIYRFPHGRNVGPPGGSPLEKWITEYTLSPGKGTVMGPDGVTPQTGAAATLTPADKTHFRAKALLRSLVSNVNKGIAREYFFAAHPSALAMIDEGFFSAAEAHPGTYPGDALGGETMNAFRNMLARFQGPGPSGAARQLTLLSIAQDGNHAQFAGDGTSAHPPLYDRNVLPVLPFQSSPTRFVIPVYVMTRDMLTLYEPTASPGDIHRFDLPDETFRVTLGNLPETSTGPSVSAYDPIRDQSTPARMLSREGATAVFELSATDYPRLLTLDYTGH
jgi:hypothetical protein